MPNIMVGNKSAMLYYIYMHARPDASEKRKFKISRSYAHIYSNNMFAGISFVLTGPLTTIKTQLISYSIVLAAHYF